MRVHLATVGCRLNEAELETWSRDFRARGHELARAPDEADLVVVNTCAVTDEAVRKSRKLVRRAQRASPQARLVLSGCYASLDPQRAARELGVDLVVSNADKDRLVDIAARALALPSVPVEGLETDAHRLFARGRQRAFVKVQDGCRHRCTFCVVTLARGPERSRSLDAVVAEVDALGRSGVNEVVLTGVHLGGWGSDLGLDLRALVAAVLERTTIPRVRLGSLEPWNLPAGFFELFANPRLMPSLHLPLQSGSDAVLRRMARRCRADEYRELAAAAHAAVPDLVLTTDVIAGFPGETDADWQATLELVADVGFGHVHVFPYSARPGTRAASMPDPVEEGTRRERARALQALNAGLATQALARFLGRELAVLVEGRVVDLGGGLQRLAGYSPGFLRCAFTAPAGADLVGGIVTVRAEAVDADGTQLRCRLLPATASDDAA
jgi:threonylcarbamoyladenosine tRNA methylthiotransferase MtaB